MATAFALLFSSLAVNAGFLEMPNTTETPQLERHSLLLDLDIPAVRDRDPDPQAGPRLNVKEFRIQGLVEYPEVGITREKIIQQVESIRFDMMGEGKLLGSGYTIDELSKVSDLIADIEQQTEGQHVGPLEVQKLVFLIREQRRQRGITVGMIETVADTITRYYREHGFILAKAYIPKQEVRDGIVTLTVLLGELGEVEIHNNKRYSSKTIQNIFKEDLAKPITNDHIEEKLYLVNDLPGLSVQGYFEPGSQVGDSKLNVNVTQEQWYDANLRLDNHGSDRSGKDRAFAQFLLHNPLTVGDELEVGVLESFLPQNSTYGSLNYSLPLFSPRLKWLVGGSTNDFVLGSGNPKASSVNSSQNISGQSRDIDTAFTYQFKRSRVSNYSAGLKVSQIKSEMQIGNLNSGFLNSTVRNIDLSFDFDSLNEKARVLHQGSIVLVSSHFLSGGFEGQNRSPYILNFDYSRLSFITVPFTNSESRLVMRLSGQYAGTSLGSINQYSLGGPTRTRGFTVNEYYADDAVFGSADWIFKGPEFKGAKLFGERLDNLMQPFVFADLGYGVARAFEQGSDATNAKLVDIGAGLKLNYTEKVKGNIVLAVPVLAKNSALEDGKKPSSGLNMYFDLQVSF